MAVEPNGLLNKSKLKGDTNLKKSAAIVEFLNFLKENSDIELNCVETERRKLLDSLKRKIERTSGEYLF